VPSRTAPVVGSSSSTPRDDEAIVYMAAQAPDRKKVKHGIGTPQLSRRQ
jgi:hypothetical protein